jgi:hypothetical protein
MIWEGAHGGDLRRAGWRARLIGCICAFQNDLEIRGQAGPDVSLQACGRKFTRYLFIIHFDVEQ